MGLKLLCGMFLLLSRLWLDDESDSPDKDMVARQQHSGSRRLGFSLCGVDTGRAPGRLLDNNILVPDDWVSACVEWIQD